MINLAHSRLMPDNPVMTKEMRVRMRGSRAYWLMFGYIGFLAAVMLLTYWGWLQSVGQYGGYSRVSQLGQQLYNAIFLTQLCLALIITPAITAGSLTIEKEQRTLEMLTMTRLSLPKIVFGKLLSGVLFTGLLLVTSLPLVALTFTFGGIDPMMILGTYTMLFTGSFLMGALGVMWSGIAKATSQAVIYTYLTAILLAVAGSGLYAGYASRTYSNNDFVISLINSVSMNWFGTRFLGFTVPEGFGFIFNALLIGTIFVMVAVSKLEAKPERRAWQLRGLTALFFGIQIYSALREMAISRALVHLPMVPSNETLSYETLTLIFPSILLMFLVPIFCTGERTKIQEAEGNRFFLRAFSPRGLRAGFFNSGLPFMLLLVLLSGGLLLLAGLKTPNLGMAMLILGASVAGFGRFCQFLSVLFRNRWAAWFFATLFYGYVAFVPFISSNCYSNNSRPPLGFFIDAAYFDPTAALLRLSWPGLSLDHLLLGSAPLSNVLLIAWGMVFVGSGLMIGLLAKRRKTA